ncbi:unnamed protein product [Caenorhabditis auriculariae]|uniref:RUN and TBC1 domain-containing protein 3 n=1 Tax=Caenorhabditis auriculariae TaxID=2777116 RepID=A0A8S1H5Q4_9PELO|nr:unnamed protein product [Caenorhabditis auriculariae]
MKWSSHCAERTEMRVTTRNAFIFLVLCLQGFMILLRFISKGAAYYRVVRIHSIVTTECVMLIGSLYIWSRLSHAVCDLLPSDHEHPMPARWRWRRICMHDVARSAVVMFLVLSHLSFLFYYIFLGAEPNLFALVCLSAMAAFLHVFFFLLLADFIYYSMQFFHECVFNNSVYMYLRRSRSYHILLAFVCGMLFMFGGLVSTRMNPVYVDVDIPMRKFSDGSENISIALLSDIHIGPSVGRTRMETIVKLTNKLKPDIIAIAGDLADGMVRDFGNAAAPLWNHEYMHGNVAEWFDFLRLCNITILHNQSIRKVIKGHKMCIAGADDLYAARSHFPGHGMDLEKALSECNSNDTVVLLAHQPNAAKLALRNETTNGNIDLILSGHTHGGQMYLFVPIVYLANAFARGLYFYEKTKTWVYASGSGVIDVWASGCGAAAMQGLFAPSGLSSFSFAALATLIPIQEGKDAKYADAISFDDDDGLPVARKVVETTKEIDQPVHSSFFALNGSPLSAINAHLIPPFIEDPIEFFDEFGFRKKDENLRKEEISGEEDHNEPCSSTDIESGSHKMKFISMLQNMHEDVKEELMWSHIHGKELRGDKFEELLKEGGIPHSMRPFLWARLTGATTKQRKAGYSYEEVLKQSALDKPSIGVQIERDLLRTMPTNICFWKKNEKGVDSLRRILKAVAFIYPDLGYCQGMGVIVASLLLYCSEETTFWMMTALIEDILPPNYYSQTLLGLQADERVARHLMKCHVPDLNKALDDYEVEISLLTVNWLLTLFGTSFPTLTLLRVWDFIFYYGSVTMFRVIVSILKIKEDYIVDIANSTKSSADIFNALSQIPHAVNDVDQVLEYMESFEFTITDHLISELRKKHQAILMADQGMIVNTTTDTNLPKQTTQRRKLTRSKSIIQQIFHNKEEMSSDPKMKNVRQTEILVDLKESVLQICRYFISCDEKMEMNVCTQTDYSPESHTKDIENYLKGRREGHKRARALLDFARQDEDELGFRKNDIITIISEKDEHCWVGEVNGLRGWFPAKFVEVVDERGKSYTIYGDEAVSPEVTEYIRGRLANSFRQIMDHGIRESALYPSTPYHPWSFLEDIAYYSVEKNFSSVYSRLTLCNTFNLDQDGKLLTPEELLFRSVQMVNDSHNAASAHPDVKLRSLLVVGVNEQCLHLWFELLCATFSHEHIRNKYYHSWAFIRSPAWRQIKCDLRLLSQFSFNLGMCFEIEGIDKKKKKNGNGMFTGHKKRILSTVVTSSMDQKNGDEPLKQGVTDMLIKHHLFSWDL